MHLDELLVRYAHQPESHVPTWMIGAWKRRSISYFNGLTDLQTHVFWVQSRNLSIDLRLPVEADQPPHRSIDVYSARELEALSQYEGWSAPAHWDGNSLTWAEPQASLQLHNRWPEPALLRRTGNCMIEHSPSNVYVEDWRLQSAGQGMVVGLELEEEREVRSGRIRHRGGALIICGAHAGLVLGRAHQPGAGESFPARVQSALGDADALGALFDFECSVACRQGESFRVSHSTRPGRIGEILMPLEGFEPTADGRIIQSLLRDGVAVERRFRIDSLETRFEFAQHTPCAPSAAQWYDRESRTLARYVRPVG